MHRKPRRSAPPGTASATFADAMNIRGSMAGLQVHLVLNVYIFSAGITPEVNTLTRKAY